MRQETLIHRILKTIAWPYAVAYMGLWSVFMWFAQYGGVIRANADCAQVPDAPLPLWTCSGDGFLSIAALVVDLALLLTVWAPAFVAAATVNAAAIPIAASLVAGHLLGLAASVYAMVRVFGWIIHRMVRAIGLPA